MCDTTTGLCRQEILLLLSMQRTLAVTYINDRFAETEYYHHSARDILGQHDSITVDAVEISDDGGISTHDTEEGSCINSETLVEYLHETADVALVDIRSMRAILQHRLKNVSLSRDAALTFLDSICTRLADTPGYLELYLRSCAIELNIIRPSDAQIAEERCREYRALIRGAL